MPEHTLHDERTTVAMPRHGYSKHTSPANADTMQENRQLDEATAWPRPHCGRRPAATCFLCKGTGGFDPALLGALRRLRQERYFMLKDAADDLGVSASTLSRLERGETLRARSWTQRQAAVRLLERYLLLADQVLVWRGTPRL